MDILEIEGATHRFGEPTNWQETSDGVPCGVLPVRVDNSGAGGMMVATSKWRPSEADLQVLNSGGSLYLGIYGLVDKDGNAVHPVIHMYVGDPQPPERSAVVN